MKYKLKKHSQKLQGKFTIGGIYKTQPYSPDTNFYVLQDDSGKPHLINTKKSNFKECFLNINKERKEKLLQIEKS